MSSSCSAPSPSYELYKLFRHNDSSLTAGYAVWGGRCVRRTRVQRASQKATRSGVEESGVEALFLQLCPLRVFSPNVHSGWLGL